MLKRVLIANRGEIAVRIIRALHEAGAEAVAVYSTADREAMHVRMADRAVCIGPPPASESYLNIPSVVAAAEITGCDAVHPGYGFLAENPAFVRACEDNDLVFVGPDAQVMERMGDKVLAKAAVAEANVPVVPGTAESITLKEAKTVAGELGFPVLLKASAGGGGKGMRLVDDRRNSRAPSTRRRPRHSPHSGTAASMSRRRSFRLATSRSRCLPMGTAASSRWASASARSSAATRS